MKQPGPNLRAILILIFAACIWLLPLVLHPFAVPYQPGADFTDLLVSHWPNAQYIRTSIREIRQVPLWNSQILCGAPLVADPLFSLWYPPMWFTLVLPISFAQNLIFWLHLILAGVGMYFLMRSEGLGERAALTGGLFFGGAPKLVGHVALGHISLICAVAWTPWVLLSLRRVIIGLHLPWRIAIKRAAMAGAAIGITFLADPRWLVPLALLGASFSIHEFVFTFKGSKEQKGILRKSIILGMFCIILSLLLAAGQAIPLMQFALRSTRANILSDSGSFGALPPDRLLGLLFPVYGGWGEWQIYFGMLGLGLVLFGLLSSARDRYYWLGVAVAGFLLALGDATPLHGFVAEVFPFMKWIRVPARFVFISYLAMSALAAWGMQALELGDGDGIWKKLRIAIVGLAFFVSGISIGALVLLQPTDINSLLPWCVPLALAWIMAGLVLLMRSGSMAGIQWPSVLLVLIMIEIGVMNASLLSMQVEPTQSTFNPAILRILEAESDVGRVLSLGYNIPQNIASQQQLELADGVNPLQLESYWVYMAQAVGFDPMQYSVTLPPYPDGLPTGADGSKLNPDMLGRLNITHVIAGSPLRVEGLELLHSEDGTQIYRNTAARPRAWVEYGDGMWEPATVRLWSPNRIQVEAVGPGRLVLAEMMYAGWTVRLNGKLESIDSPDGLLRSIEIPDGSNQVDFRYQPWDVYIGCILSLLAILILLVLWWRL